MKTRVVEQGSYFFVPTYIVEYYNEEYQMWSYVSKSASFCKLRANAIAKNISDRNEVKNVISEYGEN